MAKMWKLVLCLMVAGWGSAAAEIGHNMNNITRSMLREVADVMEMVEVNYSTPIINTTYVASVEFDMRAMGPLYNSTHTVIDAIANKQAYPEGIVTVADGHVYIKPVREEWRKLLVHYAGPTAFVVVAVLVIAVLPLAGLFWCCCYWCRVGRRRRPFDRKYDACLKGLLAIVLIALLTLFLFGVVCAFATDSQVESGSAEAADSLRAGIRDAREFLNATQAHARWLLVVNYKELETKLNAMLYSIGVTASVKLGEFSRAVSVTTLNKMVQQLDDVQADLRSVQSLTATLRHKAEQLNSGLRKVKNQLLQTLAKCDQPKCVALQNKYKIGQLDTEIQYSQMPDVSELLNNVTVLLESDIKSEVAEGQKVFRDIQRGIQRSVDQHIPGVSGALSGAGQRLARVADHVTWLAGNASARLHEQRAAADTLAALHARYGPYRRYAGLGAAAALLLLTALLAWGLMCGVCGKRPDVYGASDCCNKGAGSKSLLCGSGVTFVLGGGVALVMLAYFLAGVLAQRFVCDPLTEPRDNRLFADLEKLVELEKTLFNEQTDPDFNMTSVLVHCHRNYTVYETLQLRRLYDLEAVAGALPGELRARVAALRPALAPGAAAAPHVAILRAPARHKLRQLADTGLSDFDFDRISTALETNMTSLALDSLARQLNSTAWSLQQPLFAAEARSLQAAAAALGALLRDVLQPLLHDAAQLNATAARLRDSLRFNHSSLKDAIAYLMHETTEAEVFLNTQGPDRLQNMTQEFAEVIAGKLEEYLSRVLHAARHEVGRCGPLSNAYNATRDAACNKILMPTNGYWMSLCWCVLLFVPLLLVSQRLARLYLHVDAYPGPLVEAEYLYDAYADRDNVPLANAYKAEKRAGREGREARDGREGRGARGGRGEGEGRGGGSGAPLAARADAALAPPLDAYHARRYNDMAPKHWEEGPPRYHGPTEYERPPPYYYPGPKGQRGRNRQAARRGAARPESWAEYLSDSSAASTSHAGLARMPVINSSNTQEPGTSWAQYLHNSEPGPSPLTIAKNRQAENPKSESSKTQSIDDRPSAPRLSLRRGSDPAPASWARYLASR
ncbi:unnamed protein product [Chrysodeixis includens]|uniref:Prominin-like protein n=1 Tax=Chrysodeixis includens TaxID=689277 RepID=A0A9P0BH86_CHRIL|nr:unnamed protein product [Chrysodeixis includens]